MTGVTKQGCVHHARYQNRELVRAKKNGQWSLALHCRIGRDDWMAEARAKYTTSATSA